MTEFMLRLEMEFPLAACVHVIRGMLIGRDVGGWTERWFCVRIITDSICFSIRTRRVSATRQFESFHNEIGIIFSICWILFQFQCEIIQITLFKHYIIHYSFVWIPNWITPWKTASIRVVLLHCDLARWLQNHHDTWFRVEHEPTERIRCEQTIHMYKHR